jgi:hypothetical protein
VTKFLALIPAYNEAAHVAQVVTGASAHLPVLVVDDGSTDDTATRAEKAGATERGADLIIGARDFSHMPPVRRLSNTVGGWAFSWAIGQPIRDNQSGYRLISRRLLEAILTSDEAGFEFEVEMIVVCVQHSFKLDWVPIRTIYAGEGSHIRPWHHTLNFTRMVWQTRKSRK